MVWRWLLLCMEDGLVLRKTLDYAVEGQSEMGYIYIYIKT